MNISSIKGHLRPYRIVAKRKTTINHAFASAIAPNEEFEEGRVAEAMRFLGLDPQNLMCTYCNEPAETWDHIVGTVKDSVFSGYGHVLGNLVPCCKKCNSRKGNYSFEIFARQKVGLSSVDAENLIARIKSHQSRCGCPGTPYEQIKSDSPDEIRRLEEIKEQIIGLMSEADELADKVRSQHSS